MLVRKAPDSFFLVNQHDHAQVSGQMAQYWHPAYFSGDEKKESVLTAIYQHDRAWINLDAAPFWNDRDHIPYSFTDYPIALKVVHYEAGINQVQETDQYAALLNSLHYTTFPDLAASEFGQQFLETEAHRQATIKENLDLNTPEAAAELRFHLQLLKFCDSLSIYLCLNEPGVKKEEEHPWYRAGIPNSDQFAFTNGEKIQAAWLSATQIQVSPFPFITEFTVTVPYKNLTAVAIAQDGLTLAFQEAQPAFFQVTISG